MHFVSPRLTLLVRPLRNQFGVESWLGPYLTSRAFGYVMYMACASLRVKIILAPAQLVLILILRGGRITARFLDAHSEETLSSAQFKMDRTLLSLLRHRN